MCLLCSQISWFSVKANFPTNEGCLAQLTAASARLPSDRPPAAVAAVGGQCECDVSFARSAGWWRAHWQQIRVRCRAPVADSASRRSRCWRADAATIARPYSCRTFSARPRAINSSLERRGPRLKRLLPSVRRSSFGPDGVSKFALTTPAGWAVPDDSLLLRFR